MDIELLRVLTEQGPLALVAGWLLWERRETARVMASHTTAIHELILMLREHVRHDDALVQVLGVLKERRGQSTRDSV